MVLALLAGFGNRALPGVTGPAFFLGMVFLPSGGLHFGGVIPLGGGLLFGGVIALGGGLLFGGVILLLLGTAFLLVTLRRLDGGSRLDLQVGGPAHPLDDAHRGQRERHRQGDEPDLRALVG